MLTELVKELGSELKMEDFITNPTEGRFHVSFKNNVVVEMADYTDQYILKGTIGPLPKEGIDPLLTRVMDANLFGKGVHGGVMGLDSEGKALCLIFNLSTKISYKDFKERLTKFVNTIRAWRKILESPPVKPKEKKL